MLMNESAWRDGKTSYYLCDRHGNVRALVNEEGTITDSYAYDAYGNLLQAEGETKNDFLYTGEQYNATIGLYYLRARYMNPTTGTFISMDSYQGNTYDPITLHKYLYVGANPVMYVDPTGYDRDLSSTCVTMGIMEVIGGMMSSPFVSKGMSILYQLKALTVVESVSSISAGVIVGAAIDGVVNGDESIVARLTSMILENALPLIVYVKVTSEMLAVQARVKAEAKRLDENEEYPGVSVYVLMDSLDGYAVKYVGISNNPVERAKQHARDDSKKTNGKPWHMYIWASGKTRREARMIEQSLICVFTIDALANARYEIAVKNIPGFKNELKTAASLLKIPYQNLENLVNRKEWNG